MIERFIRNSLLMDAMQSITTLPTCVVNSSIWRNIGSFSLPPHQGVVPLMSWVSLVIRLKKTSLVATLIPIESCFAIGLIEMVEDGTAKELLTKSWMQNLKVYKWIKQDIETIKEKSMKQVSKGLVNLRMHDSFTVLEAFLPLVIYKRFTSMNSLKSEKW